MRGTLSRFSHWQPEVAFPITLFVRVSVVVVMGIALMMLQFVYFLPNRLGYSAAMLRYPVKHVGQNKWF